MRRKADVVICGAGITGVAAAHFLSKSGVKDILLIDERPPLSFTSDRSTECYRNWWPDPQMLALLNRSISLMEALAQESGNVFRMNRRGYLYVTADEGKIQGLQADSLRIASQGAGRMRVHSADGSSYQPAGEGGFESTPDGADLLLGSELVHKYFPYLTQDAVAALHVRRAGWLSAQQLGMYLFQTGRARGVRFESARVTGVDVDNDHVSGVELSSGERIGTPVFINAAGPFLKEVGSLLGVNLPVHTELHLKAAIKDSLQVVDRNAPLLIWTDPLTLPWEPEEREALSEDESTRYLTEVFPPGVHVRPDGAGENQTILMLWDYKTRNMDPVWPPVLDDQYPEVVLRGLTAMLPRMQEYFARMPRPQLDGGYYTKTPENRPLIGPMCVDGAYVTGAVSGYGIMSSCGVGELLASHVTGSALPAYAPAFTLERYDDPEYQKMLEEWDNSGQL
jgi:glycine/D-amino acid oxidase-like deaminating enzyme